MLALQQYLSTKWQALFVTRILNCKTPVPNSSTTNAAKNSKRKQKTIWGTLSHGKFKIFFRICSFGWEELKTRQCGCNYAAALSLRFKTLQFIFPLSKSYCLANSLRHYHFTSFALVRSMYAVKSVYKTFKTEKKEDFFCCYSVCR